MNREERRKKNKAKLPYEKIIEQRNREHNSVLNEIISLTMMRDLGLEEKEYLKKIGFGETDKTEEEAHRISIYNIVLDMQKVILSIERQLEMINGTFEAFMLEKGMAERETESEFKDRLEKEKESDGK